MNLLNYKQISYTYTKTITRQQYFENDQFFTMNDFNLLYNRIGLGRKT